MILVFQIVLSIRMCKNLHLKTFYSTIIEPNIDIDTEILQNKVILRRYWYCKSKTFDIVIDIDIAYLKKMVLIPILILID